MPLHRALRLLAPIGLLAACSAEPDTEGSAGDAITSNDGTVLELSFEGEVTAATATDTRPAIVAQLQYVQGILTTAANANAQVGLVALENIEEKPGSETKVIRYAAKLPFLWPKDRPVPATYDLVLPRDTTKLAEFNSAYDGKCGKAEYGTEAFWHDWNPRASGCKPAAADVLRVAAKVGPSPQRTTGKYPEYDRVWADDRLDVTLVFGLIAGNSPTDEAFVEMESTLSAMSRTLRNPVRADVPSRPPASLLKHQTLTGDVTVAGRARKVNVTAMLVSELQFAGADFDAAYKEATKDADLVVYSGHSGLGKNIDVMAKRATAVRDKYQLFYLQGCQTFAYLGRDLHDAKIAANGKDADPNGTRDLDVVANALPAYGDNGRTTMTLYGALVGADRPKDYNTLLQDFSRLHLVGVFGEEDNVFHP